jgi:hypothetical protein
MDHYDVDNLPPGIAAAPGHPIIGVGADRYAR